MYVTPRSELETTRQTNGRAGGVSIRGVSRSNNGIDPNSRLIHLKQAIYGRVFHTLADVRAAVAAFVERYNQCWRLEKLAYRTPLEAREQYELRHAA